MHTQFADTSSRPEELSPTTLNEERNDNNKDMETDSVTAISSSPSTSPDPMLSSDSRSRTRIVVAAAVVALLIMAFVWCHDNSLLHHVQIEGKKKVSPILRECTLL